MQRESHQACLLLGAIEEIRFDMTYMSSPKQLLNNLHKYTTQSETTPSIAFRKKVSVSGDAERKLYEGTNNRWERLYW